MTPSQRFIVAQLAEWEATRKAATGSLDSAAAADDWRVIWELAQAALMHRAVLPRRFKAAFLDTLREIEADPRKVARVAVRDAATAAALEIVRRPRGVGALTDAERTRRARARAKLGYKSVPGRPLKPREPG